MIRKYSLWMHFISPIPLKSLGEDSLLYLSSLSPFRSFLTNHKNTRAKSEQKNNSKKLASLRWKHLGQSCPKYCHSSSADNSFHSRALSDLPDSLTDYYIQNGFENLQRLEMLLRHLKMSLFRKEHITPAKFVGLKPLPIRIKRPSSSLKWDYQYTTCLLMRNSGFLSLTSQFSLKSLSWWQGTWGW